MERVKNLLKDQKNYTIVTVTHDYLFTLRQKTIEDSDYFTPDEINSSLILDNNQINNIFDKLDKIVSNIPDKLVIIVFEEYFFSKNIPMNFKEIQEISDNCKKFTSKYQNSLLFINLLHYIQILDNFENIKDNIRTYSNTIVSRNSKTFIWDVSSLNLLKEESSNMFIRNCTYIYMFGKELYSHKKSTYCNEYEDINNYDIGFFEKDEINKELLKQENELAQLIIDNFELHICFDFTFNFEEKLNFLEKNQNNNFYFDELSKNEVNKLLHFYNSQNIKKNKKHKNKIYIIQSNYFNLNSTERFSEGDIVIKSDPLQQFVFKVKKSKEIDNLINNIDKLYENYLKNCEHVANDYLLEGIKNSKKNRINEFHVLNFCKEVELYPFKEVPIPLVIKKLKFGENKLMVKFNIYNLDKD